MRQATLPPPVRLAALVVAAIALSGCPGGDGGIGDRCESHGDCDGTLQCVSSTCRPRCQRAPECGDGYSCDSDGLCQLATGQRGDACTSEVDCAPGLSCQINGTAVDDNGRLTASCTDQNAGRPAGSTCAVDEDCRNGTCALGHCSDLCEQTRDCSPGSSCMTVPRVEANGAMFEGCLRSQGNIVFSIPVSGPTADILLPVPSGAHYASLVFSVGDLGQRVGATEVISPSNVTLLQPCPGSPCDPVAEETQYYANAVRHAPQLGASVLAMPSSPSVPLETGAYRVSVSSLRANGTVGSAIPSVTAVVRIDSAALLDVHFHFLDLEAHPCEDSFGGLELDATSAQNEVFFQTAFLGHLREIFALAGVALAGITYEDVLDHPELDGLDVTDAGSLLALGKHATGVNVFFTRTLSPVGLQAFGPTPGAAGLGGTRQSGVVIGADTLCYRSWEQVARITAHEIARYMGLHRNVEPSDTDVNPRRDPIADSDESPANLMFYSEEGGTLLSIGQRDILTRSPVLR
jgi:hypothetical protein